MSTRSKFFTGTALLIAAPFVFVVAGNLYSLGLVAVGSAFPGNGIPRDVLLSLAHITAWLYALVAAMACALCGLALTSPRFKFVGPEESK